MSPSRVQLSNNQQVFLALLRAGLWEQQVQLVSSGQIDFNEVYRLAEEQSVVGLVAAGLEQAKGLTVSKDIALEYAGQVLMIEQRNKELNGFVIKLVNKLRRSDIFVLLVKGQGVAQSYLRPLWRTAGDVDLLLDSDNYEKAKSVLFPIAYDIQPEDNRTKHQALSIMGFEVELHGTMPFTLSKRVEKINDIVVKDSLQNGGVSAWHVCETDVFLPNPDNHIILVFTHYLHHFFIEGVGLRQVCDWCRLIWVNRDCLDLNLMGERLREMKLMSEWRVFGALAVIYLGMPEEAMPFYNNSMLYKKKAKVVLKRIIKSGNFGHNNDLSYRVNYKGAKYKLVSFWRRFWDFAGIITVFPKDVPGFFYTYIKGKI